MSKENKGFPWMLVAIIVSTVLGTSLMTSKITSDAFKPRLTRAVLSSQFMASVIWENAGKPPHGVCLHVGTGQATRRDDDHAPCPQYAMLIKPDPNEPGFFIENP